jgi:hypothetical protein
MHQYVEYDTERLEKFCMQNATDSISFIEFLLISSENGWRDYSDSADNIIQLFNTFGKEQLIQQIIVSPCNLKDFSNKLEFNVMYDKEDQLYLGATIMYDLHQKFIMVYLCEYNAKIADENKDAYHVEKLMGPFFIDHPFNNQEFEESFKIFCHRIHSSIERNSHE